MENMDVWNQDGLYKEAISKWLLGSSTTALATTYPEPGLREELDAAEAAKARFSRLIRGCVEKL